MSKKFLLLFLCSINLVFAQVDDPIMKQFQQMRDEMMKQMQATDSFDAEIQKMFQRMQKMGQIQGLPDRFNKTVSMVDYYWKDSQTLVLKVSKDDEINVEVKDGMVVLSGSRVSKSQNSFSKSSFSQSIELRPALDSTKVDMSMKDGNIVLSFKLKSNRQI